MAYKHKRDARWTGAWMGQVSVNGRICRKTFATKREAELWEEDLRRAKAMPPNLPTTTPQTAMASALPSPASTPLTVAEWIDGYLDHAQRYVPKTYSEKKMIMVRMALRVGLNARVDTITAGMALQHLQAQAKDRSGNAANKDRKTLVVAWSWGRKFLSGFPATANPWSLVEPFAVQAQDRYLPPEEDFWRVYQLAQGQDRVLLLTMLHTAARRGEVYRLRWSDVDLANGRLRLTTRKRKGGSMQADWIPMTERLQAALAAHRGKATGPWVFSQSVGRHAGKPYTENRDFPQALCREAGVQEFGCHGIRHLAASILARHGTPMQVIQQILRHRRLQTTEQYLHADVEQARPHLQVLEQRPLETRTGPQAATYGPVQ